MTPAVEQSTSLRRGECSQPPRSGRLGFCRYQQVLRSLMTGCTYVREEESVPVGVGPPPSARVRHVIELSGYFRSLLQHIEREASLDGSRIHVSATLRSVVLDGRAAIPLGFVFVELVSNAVLHAFPDGRTGAIGIHLWRTEAKSALAYIIVADNGCGFPLGRRGRGIELAHRMAGRAGCKLVREPGRGTVWRLEIDMNDGVPTAVRDPSDFRVPPRPRGGKGWPLVRPSRLGDFGLGARTRDDYLACNDASGLR
jgi:anti-sigma regulatory factor (Ser/Thr protein kinase)